MSKIKIAELFYSIQGEGRYMGWFRAYYTYHAVRMFGTKSADPAGSYPIKTAP
jgi:hypothetical protein